MQYDNYPIIISLKNGGHIKFKNVVNIAISAYFLLDFRIYLFMVKIITIIAAFLFSLTIRAQKNNRCEDKISLITQLSHVCKYPIKLQNDNQEAFVAIEYRTNKKGAIIKRRVIICSNKDFRKATLKAFDKIKNIKINEAERIDTIYFQYKIQGSSTPIHPLTDIKIIGYGSCSKPVLMK